MNDTIYKYDEEGNITHRRCSCCGEWKTIDNFWFSKSRNKYSCQCRKCRTERAKKRCQKIAAEKRKNDPNKIYDDVGNLIEKRCTKCGVMKPLQEFSSDGKGKKRATCKICKARYAREKRKDPDVLARKREADKRWAIKKRQKIKENNFNNLKHLKGVYKGSIQIIMKYKSELITVEYYKDMKKKAHRKPAPDDLHNLLRVYKGKDLIFRRCSKCHELHPIDMFRKKSGKKDGLENCCKYYSNLKKREYNKTPQGRLSKKRQRHNRRVKEKKGTWTLEQWEECLKFFDNKCAYTGQPMNVVTMDHIIALNKGGTNNISNIIPADVSPNSSKCDNDLWEWYSKQPYFSWKRYLKICMWIIKNM